MDWSWNTSYVYGVDDESGWGPRYFFTYFTQFGSRNLVSLISEVIILVMIFLLSVFANIIIAICVIRFAEMKTVTNCFVLNLSAADLLFAFSIPAVAYTRTNETWKLGVLACKLIPYAQFVSGIVLLWTLALISIDRHRCIVIPPYRSKMVPRDVLWMSGLIWILITVLFLPIIFWFREQTTSDGKLICTLVFPKSDNIQYSLCFILPVVLLACILPMVILIYNYQRIFHKIITTRNTWASSCVEVNNTDNKKSRGKTRRQSELSISDIFVPWPRKLSLSQQEEIRLNKHVKVVRVLFLNVIMVLLMWLPITVIMFLILIDGRRSTENRDFFLRSHHFLIALIIALLNTVINPVLYGLMSESFRVCLRKMLCCKTDNEKSNIIIDKETPSSGRNHGSFKVPRKHSFVNSVSEVPDSIV